MVTQPTGNFDIGPASIPSKNVLWIDLETSGLDELDCGILEIGWLVSTADLSRVVSSGSWLVEWSGHWESATRELHRASGFLAAWAIGQPNTLEESTETLCSLIRAFDCIGQPLAGSSVHFDRRFLRRHMPEVEVMLGYRNLDISTVREFVRTTGLHSVPDNHKSKHRALSDVWDSWRLGVRLRKILTADDVCFLPDEQ